MNLPGIGIGACIALTRLEVNNARGISADSQQDWYETEHKLPETMSTMVSLRNLSVSVTGSQVALEHFGRVPNLKRLHILHEHISALTGNVASLSGLQVLKITSFSYAGDIPHMSSVFKTPVALHFSWEKLQGLRIIDITGPLVFGKSILKVAGLPRLKLFQLAFFRPGDVKTSRHLADLADLLAKQRPDVHVLIDELDHLPLGLLD